MKQSWRLLAVTLLLVTSSIRCSTMDGPEAAAKINFSEWAVNIKAPYRNETFETIHNDGNLATVRITVELKLKGTWEEKQIEIQCKDVVKGVDTDGVKVWTCDRSMPFK